MGQKLSAVFLDLDGTLIESVGIKDDAFAAIYADYTQHLEEIMTYHKAHNHVVRFDKFRHIAAHILHQELTPEKEAQLAEQFSTFVFEKIVSCPSVAGADDFLHKFYGILPLILISKTPDQELHKILEARSIFTFFDQVYGSSWQKDAAILDYLKRQGLDGKNGVYIGDTQEDRDYAEKAGVTFIGRNSGRVFDSDLQYLYDDMSGVAVCLTTHFSM